MDDRSASCWAARPKSNVGLDVKLSVSRLRGTDFLMVCTYTDTFSV